MIYTLDIGILLTEICNESKIKFPFTIKCMWEFERNRMTNVMK